MTQVQYGLCIETRDFTVMIFTVISSIFLVAVAMILWYHKQNARLKNAYHGARVIDPDNLEIIEKIGRGHFGDVFKGLLKEYEDKRNERIL